MVQTYIDTKRVYMHVTGKMSMNNTRIAKIYVNVTKVLGLEN